MKNVKQQVDEAELFITSKFGEFKTQCSNHVLIIQKSYNKPYYMETSGIAANPAGLSSLVSKRSDWPVATPIV